MPLVFGIIGFLFVSYLIGLIFFKKEANEKAKFRKGAITTLILVCVMGSFSIYYFYKVGQDIDKQRKEANLERLERKKDSLLSRFTEINKDYCSLLDEATFVDEDNHFFHLTLYNEKDNKFSFVGHIMATDINGTLKRVDDELIIISGNIEGKFTLLSACKRLIGSLVVKQSQSSVSIDFVRK